jgi:exodeoxyribonuclease V alpha subunit
MIGCLNTDSLCFAKEILVEKITGFVDHIIFRNADNGYTVLVLIAEEEEITCVGCFSAITEGENIEITGEYTAHPTYGKQLRQKNLR